MFSGSMFRFDEDPFFSSHMSMMQQMNDSMRMMHEGLFMSPHSHHRRPAIGDVPAHPAHHAHRARSSALAHPMQSADPFQQMFQGFGSMFSNMGSLMEQMQSQADPRNNPNGSFYSHSSVMSYSNTGQGPPKIFQASSSTTQGPGGVRETRKTMRDSEKGLEKMAVGHHIGERGHVIERQRDTRTGDQEENQEYINLEEDEADTFNQEFQERAHSFRPVHRSHGQRAVTDGRSRDVGFTATEQEAAKRHKPRKSKKGYSNSKRL